MRNQSSKFQVPNSKEISNPRHSLHANWVLKFRNWNFFGTWNLEFGTFTP
jgi:hypothetical protein